MPGTQLEHNVFSCRRQQSKPEKSWLAQQWAGVDTKCVFQTKFYPSSFSLCVILRAAQYPTHQDLQAPADPRLTDAAGDVA